MARELARRAGYVYIDTGAMYRAVTLFCIEQGLARGGSVDEEALRARMGDIMVTFRMNPSTGHPDTYLNGRRVEERVRSLDVSGLVSRVAALGFVREAMVGLQRLMGEAKGVVMDGRDIGTVVFPHAELKVFVTASAETRARRRHAELEARGEKCDYADILRNVQERDRLDSTRAISPLRKAADALTLDNSAMTPAEQDAWLWAHFSEAAGR